MIRIESGFGEGMTPLEFVARRAAEMTENQAKSLAHGADDSFYISFPNHTNIVCPASVPLDFEEDYYEVQSASSL